jgi:hypothetical protein
MSVMLAENSENRKDGIDRTSLLKEKRSAGTG